MLKSLASLSTEFAQWLSAHSQDKNNGIIVVHCMDARLHARDTLKVSLVTPNALTPPGALLYPQDKSAEKRLEVARANFAMKDILIMGHQDCAAMKQLANVLLGKKQDSYYQDFLISGKGFPKLDLGEFIRDEKEVTPALTDNLAILTALHSARNTLAYEINDTGPLTSIGNLIDAGLVRLHIGYTGLQKATGSKWTESHYLLSNDGSHLVRTKNLAQAIIAQRSEPSTLEQFKARLKTAQKSFEDLLARGELPTFEART